MHGAGWIQEWPGPATEIMLDMAHIGPGSRVLHVAAGSGQEAIQTARRVGPDGYILATDFSENLVRLTRQNARPACATSMPSSWTARSWKCRMAASMASRRGSA